MAHFAEIDQNNTVTRVIVVHDSLEASGAEWCAEQYGGRWVQTSYTGRIRKNFAGVGYTYDPVRDAFIPVQPFPSWVLNHATMQWESPVPRPDSGHHVWDEQSNTWIEVPPP